MPEVSRTLLCVVIMWMLVIGLIVMPIMDQLSEQSDGSDDNGLGSGGGPPAIWEEQFPRNLTRNYRGSYEPRAAGLPSDREAGELSFHLISVGLRGPPQKLPVQYVRGRAVLRTRSETRDTDMHLAVEGVYFYSSGLLQLFGNDPAWHATERLAKLPEVQERNFSASDIRTIINDSMDQEEADWIEHPSTRPEPPGDDYSDCVAQLNMRWDTILAATDPRTGEQVVLLNEDGTLPQLDMAGVLQSSKSLEGGDQPPCRLDLELVAHSVTDEEYFQFATRYGFVALFVAIAQLRLLIHHMRTTLPTRGNRMSIISLGWRTLIDALYCLFHFTLALQYNALFNTFVIVALLQFCVFSMLELRVMMKIRQARHPELFESMSQMRQQFRHVYLRFYCAMFAAMFMFVLVGNYPQFYLPFLFSYWVPQIVLQARENINKSMSWSFLGGMTATRFFLPLYLLGCPYNFFNMDVYPATLWVTGLWLAAQVGVLVLQDKIGPRWFVPQRFLPEIYRYHRAMPSRRGGGGGARGNNGSESGGEEQDDIEMAPLIPAAGAGDSAALPAVGEEGLSDEDSDGSDGGDNCAICYCELDGSDDPAAVMVTPCEHVFHTPCLLTWMEQKMECPTCRFSPLPLYEEGVGRPFSAEEQV